MADSAEDSELIDDTSTGGGGSSIFVWRGGGLLDREGHGSVWLRALGMWIWVSGVYSSGFMLSTLGSRQALGCRCAEP